MSPADRVDRTAAAVVAVALVALAARLVGLGQRPFHWDEARVGVWALHFARAGLFEYRPVAGGPLPYHLARASLSLFGSSDAAARLPVALVGGLVPLSALGLRSRLRDDETVLLALVLAFSPPLLYYGRVLRGDLLLAVAAFVACVLVVYAVDAESERQRRVAAYGAVLAAAAAVAASGFVVVTLACVVVAALVVGDGTRLSVEATEKTLERVRSRSTLLARLVLVFLGATVFLFAPRGEAVSLWSPTTFPAVFAFVFSEAPGRFFTVRVATRFADGATHPLLPFVISLARTLLLTALPTVGLAVAGGLHERYLGERRPLVVFLAVWAAAGLLLVPAATEVDAPWLAVHVLVPLAVPAAVGAARGIDLLRGAVDRSDAATVAAVLLVASAGVVQVGGILADDVYGEPTPESRLAQYAQPADDLEPFAANVSDAVESGQPTVLYYGDRFYTEEWTEQAGPPVPEAWGERLPLPWYVAREGGTATSLRSGSPLPENPPPVVVTDPQNAPRIAGALDGYERSRYRLGLFGREVVVFSTG